MGLFEDFSRFLEGRLEEFLRNNPHLELQALEEQLREQEEATQRLMIELRAQETRIQEEILSTAQEVQRWHIRIEKAKTAGRFDLVQPAQEREAALLRQGNQLWGKMKIVQERMQQTQILQQQVQVRRKEVQAKVAEATTARANTRVDQPWETVGWNQGVNYTGATTADPLEAQFRRWEAQEELDELKRNLGR